ncbi:MAG: hypothetical protein HRU46_13785 [Verrucomicrobiales bacterium]|nr:hypothetical protein [Verrucomicrobiales bacterium]
MRIENRRTGNTSGQRSRGSASEEKLNELGEQGWELVSVRNDGSDQPVFYFKRPKSGERPAECRSLIRWLNRSRGTATLPFRGFCVG